MSINEAAERLLDELKENPLPAVRYAYTIVRDRLPAILAHERSAGADTLDVERMADLIDKAKDRRYSDESLGIIFRDIVVSSEGTDR